MPNLKLLQTLEFSHNGLEFHKQSRVRGGNLWALTQEKTLLFCELKNPKSARIVPDLNAVMFIYVSNTGRYCVVRSLNEYYLIDAKNNLSKTSIRPVPTLGSTPPKINCVSFLTETKSKKALYIISIPFTALSNKS